MLIAECLLNIEPRLFKYLLIQSNRDTIHPFWSYSSSLLEQDTRGEHCVAWIMASSSLPNVIWGYHMDNNYNNPDHMYKTYTAYKSYLV